MPFDLKKLYVTPGYVVVTAHRGFSCQYPENTIEAFLAAMDIGVDVIEFDIRGTKDGVPIVLHDPTFDRTANRSGVPCDYPLSEIKQFEASYWRGSHESGSKLTEPAVPGTRIPTFEEVLSSLGGTVGLNIQVYDTSPAILAEVCRLYRTYDLCSRGYLTMPELKDAACVRVVGQGHRTLCHRKTVPHGHRGTQTATGLRLLLCATPEERCHSGILHGGEGTGVMCEHVLFEYG